MTSALTIQNSPHELLRAIFSTLAPWELVECVLVCRVWASPALGRLYEHIDVRKGSNKMTFAARSAILCRTLDSNTSLRSLVRSLSVVSYVPSIPLPEIRSLSVLYATIPTIPSFTKILPRLQTLEHVSFHTNFSLKTQEHVLMLQAFGNLPLLRRIRYFAPFSGPVYKPSPFIPILDALPPQRETRAQVQALDLRNVTELGSFRASLEDLEWAFHPRSPLDLSRLRELSVSTYRAAKYIMRKVSETLVSLTFTSASRILGDTESQPPTTLPFLKYLCIPSETIDISLIANISCPSLECIALIWQTSTDLEPEFLNGSESPLFLIDRCITNRSNYPSLKEVAVLVNSRESCEMYPDVQRLQKLLPRCTARAVAFRFSEFVEQYLE